MFYNNNNVSSDNYELLHPKGVTEIHLELGRCNIFFRSRFFRVFKNKPKKLQSNQSNDLVILLSLQNLVRLLSTSVHLEFFNANTGSITNDGEDHMVCGDSFSSELEAQGNSQFLVDTE